MCHICGPMNNPAMYEVYTSEPTLQDLPTEILDLIVYFSDAKTGLRMSCTTKKLNHLMGHSVIWDDMIRQDPIFQRTPFDLTLLDQKTKMIVYKGFLVVKSINELTEKCEAHRIQCIDDTGNALSESVGVICFIFASKIFKPAVRVMITPVFNILKTMKSSTPAIR